jgi:hypothetical protein
MVPKGNNPLVYTGISVPTTKNKKNFSPSPKNVLTGFPRSVLQQNLSSMNFGEAASRDFFKCKQFNSSKDSIDRKTYARRSSDNKKPETRSDSEEVEERNRIIRKKISALSTIKPFKKLDRRVICINTEIRSTSQLSPQSKDCKAGPDSSATNRKYAVLKKYSNAIPLAKLSEAVRGNVNVFQTTSTNSGVFNQPTFFVKDLKKSSHGNLAIPTCSNELGICSGTISGNIFSNGNLSTMGLNSPDGRAAKIICSRNARKVCKGNILKAISTIEFGMGDNNHQEIERYCKKRINYFNGNDQKGIKRAEKYQKHSDKVKNKGWPGGHRKVKGEFDKFMTTFQSWALGEKEGEQSVDGICEIERIVITPGLFPEPRAKGSS